MKTVFTTFFNQIFRTYLYVSKSKIYQKDGTTSIPRTETPKKDMKCQYTYNTDALHRLPFLLLGRWNPSNPWRLKNKQSPCLHQHILLRGTAWDSLNEAAVSYRIFLSQNLETLQQAKNNYNAIIFSSWSITFSVFRMNKNDYTYTYTRHLCIRQVLNSIFQIMRAAKLNYPFWLRMNDYYWINSLSVYTQNLCHLKVFFLFVYKWW